MLLLLSFVLFTAICFLTAWLIDRAEYVTLEGLQIASVLIGIIAAFAIFVSAIAALAIQIPKVPDYQDFEMRRDIVESKINRIEDTEINKNNIINGDFGSLEETYNEAQDINDIIIRSRYWSDSLWLGWYYNDLVGELELIETN
ncbi:MAG: hypothetical protein ACLFMO_08140 [Eubacteriales bacterium]